MKFFRALYPVSIHLPRIFSGIHFFSRVNRSLNQTHTSIRDDGRVVGMSRYYLQALIAAYVAVFSFLLLPYSVHATTNTIGDCYLYNYANSAYIDYTPSITKDYCASWLKTRWNEEAYQYFSSCVNDFWCGIYLNSRCCVLSDNGGQRGIGDFQPIGNVNCPGNQVYNNQTKRCGCASGTAWNGSMCIVPPPQCGADEYLDTSSNTCLPKPGCIEGEQFTYCSDGLQLRRKKQQGQPTPGICEANPINSATGNKYESALDYRAATGSLSFERSYNSQSNVSGVLGYGWRHHWQASLKRYDNNTYGSSVVVTRADGQSYYFTLSGGAWLNEADITTRLTQTGSGYVLTDGPSQRETYDSAGKLLVMEGAGGESFTLSYSGNLLTSVTDQFGRSLALAYNGQGRITTLTDPANQVTSYAYDAAGNLVSVTYPGNETRTYHYENASFPHALTGITDENGDRYATWSYDAQARAVSSTHAGGADSTTLTYNADGSTTVTDALGLVRTRTFTTLRGVKKAASTTKPCSSCGGATASTTYDANGFVASRADFNGHVTNYVHDARGLETSRTEAVGTPQART
ncbi:MAG: DUF6531 domain-containing protein, partial [Nevskiales bacterium]